MEYGTLRFSWNMGLQWFLTLEDSHIAANPNTQFRGLCGDFNDNPSGKNLIFCRLFNLWSFAEKTPVKEDMMLE